MKKKLIILIAIFGILISLALYKTIGENQEKGITATGTIEVTQEDIRPKISGYLQELTIRDGDVVRAGQIIAKISRPDLKAQILRDEASLDKAKEDLGDLESGARSQEIEDANASIAVAQANLTKAQKDLERYQALYKDGAVSTKDLDSANNAYQTAFGTLKSAQARLALLQAGNRPGKISSQQMEVKRNQAVLEYSRTQLKDTIINTPLSGLILSKNFELGEYVNVGEAIATVGNLEDCWVKIYIPSSQLGLIKVGQKALVKVDSFPNQSFQGSISQINENAEFTPRQSITKKERTNQVFGVKVKLDNSSGKLKPGMPADVSLL